MKTIAVTIALCVIWVLTVTASAMQLTGPSRAAAAKEKRLASNAVLDGVRLADNSYPLLYQEFNLRTQRFMQDFEIKVVMNNKEYYLHTGDIELNINTLDLLDRLLFNNDGSMKGTAFSTDYSYNPAKVKDFANAITDELNAEVPPIKDTSPTFNLRTKTFSSEPAPSQMIGYDLDPGVFLDQVNETINDAIWNNDDHRAILDVTANPVYSKANPNPAAGFGMLSTYTTYTTDVPNRNTNIKLASQALSGVKVKPGAVFSFNGTLGYTSADKGYKEAGILVNGEPDTGLGGGICQVSSTLYNAVLDAGMRVVERHSHSARVGYVPEGRDATVNYGSLDFRFQNNTHNVCYLVFEYDNRKLSVSIYGKK